MKTETKSDFELFFNLSTDMLCIADSRGIFLKVNDKWKSVLGYSIENLVKMNFLDFVHTEDYKKTIHALSKSQKQFEPIKFINRYRCESGLYLYLEWSVKFKDEMLYCIAKNLNEIIQVDEKLKESEENFYRFFNTIDDMIFIADTHGQIVFVNKAVEKKLKFSGKESLKMTILDFHPKEYHNEAEVIFNDMLTGERNFCQIPLSTKNYLKIPVETRIWKGKWNNKECIYGISKDLSLQQAALDKFNKIFNSNPSPMALSSTSNGVFVDVNEAFLKKLGYKLKEVIGKRSADLGIFIQPEKHRESLERLKKVSQLKEVELAIKTKNGEKINGLFSAEVIDDQFDKYYLTVMTDITDIKKAHEALEKHTLLLKLILNISAEFLNANSENLNQKIDNMLKESGIYFETNRSYLFLFDQNNTYSSNTNEWCSEGIEPQKDILQKIPLKAMPWWTDKIMRREFIYIPDVKNMAAEASAEKYLLEEQSIKSLVVIPILHKKEPLGFFGFDSVTEYKLWDKDQISMLSILANILSDAIIKCRMEDEILRAKNLAESANKAKSQFLANMSHEIRTPVNGINGYLEMLKTTELNEKQKEYFEKINISQKTLLSLIDDILDLSRIESNKLVLNEKPINIFALFENMINRYLELYNKRGLDLKLYADPDIPKKLLGDEERIKQVLSNLLGNALKYTDAGFVKIEIKSKKIRDKEFDIQFLVEDTGRGIPKDVLKRIYNPFEREDTQFTKRIKGYGLGIPICKSIIEAMGGKIKIESQRNKGTKVKFNIVLKSANGKYANKFIKEEYENYPDLSLVKNLKILLAEDNEINSSLFLEILKTLGLNCDLATNGLEAVRMSSKKNYDIIFMDCQLPELDGISATKKIRKIYKSRKDYTVIAITAYAMEKDIKHCLASGIDDCIIKPINIEKLKNLIKKYS